MKGLELVRVGGVPWYVLDHIAAHVADVFGCAVVGEARYLDPHFAFDAERQQYWSTPILERLEAMRTPECYRVLGVAQVDLFVPILTFVFGEALLSRPPALISLCRLAPTFYGLPMNSARMLERASTETVHELGHTFGLLHCPDFGCAMHASHSADDIDLKGPGLCVDCLASVEENHSS